MTVLVTGAAGFIGFHVTSALLARGEEVIGIDNLNDYYDVSLKKPRLQRLDGKESFKFILSDIADYEKLSRSLEKIDSISHIVHLAAQAGVRYSLEKPFAYTRSNVEGQLALLVL